jgi:DtxR family Mn-dependent transcriptional regulator
MPNPVLALLVAAVAGLIAVVLFWPARGLFWRWMRALRATDRVLVEDALKHLYDCEANQHTCTLPSLSGAMSLSNSRAAELFDRLEKMDLVTSAAGAYTLTPEGRRYALRVIRVHRLWEMYLSDETGLDPSEWHEEAHVREHTLSAEEAETLAARMGHPRFDPHGDPIPTASGEIAAPLGQPLNDLPVGKLAEIVHVEDEPRAVYTQLVAEGLHPGMQVRIIEASPRRIRFEADSEEHVLAPVFAANLSVMPLPDDREMEGPFEKLSVLEPGEHARVTGISPRCRGAQRRRLLDLGVIPGTRVEAELASPGGDPVAYRIRGAVIALRREQADLIQVERDRNGAAA